MRRLLACSTTNTGTGQYTTQSGDALRDDCFVVVAAARNTAESLREVYAMSGCRYRHLDRSDRGGF